MGKANEPQFKFKKNMSIGAMGAEDDNKYLTNCFVNTGDFDVAINTEDPRCIVLGRTGAGKSALLETIKSSKEHVIEILPEELSLGYISNSNILKFFENLGVNLDLFYQLLWRHILTVELIKSKYKINNEGASRSFFERLNDVFSRDRRKERAINYLRQWGDQFWLETDVRIRELTSRLEDELKGSVDVSAYGISIGTAYANKLTQEEKLEISNRAQAVVNSVQIQELNQVIGFLAQEVFCDQQNKFYIVIDKLDDNWVEDRARYRLIRALIETIKTFRKVKPVKLLVALRIDLLSRVFDLTRDAGFQEEKYEDLMLRVTWSEQDLKELIDKRISFLIKEIYTTRDVGFSDIFPSKVGNEDSLGFILERTLMRPRDAILYINECLILAQDKVSISSRIIREAEISYSKKRFKNLCQEWFADYPLMQTYFEILKKKRNGIKHSDFTREQVEEIALDLIVSDKHVNDPVRLLAVKFLEERTISRSSFLNNMLRVLYKVGAIGVKKDPYSSTIWSQSNEPEIAESEVKRSSFFYVHPMLWRELGIHNDERKMVSGKM